MNNYKHTNLTTNQALNKLKQNGKNQLIKAKKKNVFALFLSQLAYILKKVFRMLL